MISRWIRGWDGPYLRPVVLALARAGVTPNSLTLLGLLSELGAAALLVLSHPGWAVAALLLGQVLDSLDGELARANGGASAFGGFLDSVCDHYGDLAIYLAFLWQYLQLGDRLGVLLVVLALFGSVFGSHVRSRAGMAGIDTKGVGAFTRFERTLVLVAGILANRVTIGLVVLAVFNNLSALQRILFALWAAKGSDSTAES